MDTTTTAQTAAAVNNKTMDLATPDLTPIETTFNQAKEMLDFAATVIVSDADSADEAHSLAKKLTAVSKKIEDQRKTTLMPYREIVDGINDFAKKLAAPIDAGVAVLRSKIAGWQRAETLRAETLRRREAAAMADAVIARQPLPDALLQTVTPAPKKLVQMRKLWRFEVLEIKKVPPQFLMVNETAVRNALTSGLLREIPGMRVWQEETEVLAR